MKSKATLLSVLLLMLFTTAGFAQRTVSGIVKSAETGEPLPSVAVTEKGTSNAVVTSIDGTFDLQVTGDNPVLVFESFGSESVEMAVGNNSFLEVSMLMATSELDEVVVTGQGLGINKRRISTTIQTIDSKEINRTPSSQLDQLIQSKLPNAQIRMSSGQPGTASIIRSRGPVSAMMNTTPVIFIDGVRVDNLNSSPQLGIATGGAQSSAIADIPMESIDRIEYIPGGAATTLYGADAANGVLQIFTKRGSGGTSQVDFDLQAGVIQGTTDFLRFDRTADALFSLGAMQQYRLGFSGGTRDFNYSFSGSVYQDDSFNDINTQARRNLRLSIFTQVTNRLTYSGSLAYSNLEFNRDYNANTSWARFGNLEGGSFGDIDEMPDSTWNEVKENLLEQGELTDITEKINRFQFSNNFRYTITENLQASFDIGLDQRNSTQRELGTNAMQISKGSAAPGTTNLGYIIQSQRDYKVVSGNLNLQHGYETGDFSFVTLLGSQFFRINDVQNSITANEVVDGSVSINNSASQQAEDFYSVLTSYGIYVNENFGYKNKMFLDLGLRLDGNSAFGEEVGLIPLPKVGAAYIISEENFFRDNLGSYISMMKLRANFGQSSVFPRAFANQRTFSAPAFLGASTFDFRNPGNPELRSEIATTWEVGADMGFWNNRIRGQVTYYNTVTDGALFTPPANPSSGQRSQLQNTGEIENTGFEVGVGADVLRTEMHRLSVNASYNYNQNLVISTGGAPEFAVGGFTFLGAFVKEGQPLGYLRGTKATINDDGSVDFEQNAFLGTTFAPTFGNFSVVYTWNNKLTVSLAGDYQYGGQGVNVDDVLRYFGGVNDEGRLPEEAVAEAGSFFDLAGFWVEDANYVKIRNIAVSYSLGSLFGESLKRSSVGISVLNPLNFVSSSFDPDITGAGIAVQGGFGGGGFGFGTESAPRMYILSLKFGI